MNEQDERSAFRAKAEAILARLDAAEVKLEAISAKHDAAERVWHEAREDFQAEIAAFRVERIVIEAKTESLAEEYKHLPPKPLDVSTIGPTSTRGEEGQN